MVLFSIPNKRSLVVKLFKFAGKYLDLNLGWFIVYIEGSQVIIYPTKIYLFSLTIILGLANSVDADEMPHYVAFHLGLHCLPKYQFRGFRYAKG